MVVAVDELDLELHAGEERRRRMEDEGVGAGVEAVGEHRDPAVVVRLARGERAGAVEELDVDPSCGLAARGVEHVG